MFDSFDNESELNVFFAGHQQCDPYYSFKGRRDHFIIHYIVSGSGYLWINGSRYKLGKGCSFIITPMQKNKYQASSKDPWKYRWVGFSGTKAREIMSTAGEIGNNNIFRQQYTEEKERNYIDLYNIMERKENGYRMKVKSLFYDILWLLLEDKRTQPTIVGKRVDYVQTCKDYIERSFDQKISISNIAELLGVNRSYLTQKFKKETGVSVQQFLISIRMEKAKDYLTNSGYLIGEIANSVGYSNYNAFVKTFKIFTGYSPSDYRELFAVRADHYYFDEVN